jgi:hypothetical protein
VEGSCEHGNEPSGSIKCLEVLEWMHNWMLLKKGSAPCSSHWSIDSSLSYINSDKQFILIHVAIVHSRRRESHRKQMHVISPSLLE